MLVKPGNAAVGVTAIWQYNPDPILSDGIKGESVKNSAMNTCCKRDLEVMQIDANNREQLASDRLSWH